MVVALREQPAKKSKLSLFRLRKSSSQSNTNTQPSSLQNSSSYHDNSIPRSNPAQTYSGYPPSAQDSTPRQAHPHVASTQNSIVRSARQAASQGTPPVIPVHYQFPEASNMPANYHWSSTSEHAQHYSDQDSEQHHYHRTRADSFPLQGFIHSADAPTSAANNFGRPNLPALARIQTDVAPSSKHSRQRSHFSIPDVIVTTCEEEGEEEVVELQIPPNKRRSYVLRDAGEDRLQDHTSIKKSSSGFVRRPAPLIQFNADEIKRIGMSRSGSNHSIGSSPVSPTTTASATSPSTPSSSASSSLSKASTAKRTRKSSFPLLFGRKSLDSSRSQPLVDQANAQEPLPFSSITPASAPPMGAHSFTASQPAGLLFSSHESGPISAPPSRSIFTRAIAGLPSPPITPTSPPRQLSKKEIKAKAKEELALIKELERVDKLVKQHDVKARKAQEKAEAKERKRAAKLAQVNQQFHQQGEETRPSVDTACGNAQSQGMHAGRSGRKTIFQAATKASATAGLARRTSIRGTPEPRSFVGERRGSEPILSKTPAPLESRVDAAIPFSIDLPASERLPFTEPRAAPRPIITNTSLDNDRFGSIPQNGPTSPPKDTHRRPSLSKDTWPSRPMRPAPPVPVSNIAPLTLVKDTSQIYPVVDAETSMGEDPDETQGWNRQSWSELNSGFTGPLPSLIHTSGMSGSSRTVGGGERENDEMDEQQNARMARRASVQRVLALSNLESGILQQRASVRKRGSQQYLKRRSSHLDGGQDAVAVQDGIGGNGGKRSSVTSDGRRRSFIRSMGDDEGWKVVEDEVARLDDSVMAQADLTSAPRSDDWLEDEEEEKGEQEVRIAASQSMEIEVDLVLADLRAAQQADHLRKHASEASASGERTPTQETVKDPFSTSTSSKLQKSPPRPNRSTRRCTEPQTATKPTTTTREETGHASSISSSEDSFCSHDSATDTADTDTENEKEKEKEKKGAESFSRRLSPHHHDLNEKEDLSSKKVHCDGGKLEDGKKSEFRLSLTLAPLQLQPLDLFAAVQQGGKF
ncbi:uncharacterized protein UTRI_05370 [Ustilago trichophora]|uniref:Uncharacterized protein n=1 Tax=Ustilago trichophora TaxID=86804 RepID=A0A5C3EJF2_9BASI|nr:uncharacterized protein UTRI_05370 [Ustilago trichophora]